jgi:hypothetical protein
LFAVERLDQAAKLWTITAKGKLEQFFKVRNRLQKESRQQHSWKHKQQHIEKSYQTNPVSYAFFFHLSYPGKTPG